MQRGARPCHARVPARGSLLNAGTRALFLGLLFALGLGTGCAKKELIRAQGAAPIRTAETEGVQKRTVPWQDRTLAASFAYSWQEVKELPPPIAAAEARLAARELARADLSRQLSRLPASEPPPGEIRESNLLDFATRQPSFAPLIEAAILSAEESVALPGDGRGTVELKLPLESLAKSLLNAGGGFRAESAVIEKAGPTAIAARAASSLAEQQLLRDILARPVAKGKTWEQWVRENPANLRLFQEAISKRRTVTSEPRKNAKGEQEFFVEYEVDLRELKRLARRYKVKAAPSPNLALPPEVRQ